MLETGIAAPGYRITPLQQLAKGGRWRTEAMRSYSQPVLYWFTRGQGRITVQGATYGYGPHNAVLLPANTMHGFDTLGQVAGSAVFLRPDPDLARVVRRQLDHHVNRRQPVHLHHQGIEPLCQIADPL